MAGRLRDNEEHHIVRTTIARLVRGPRRNLQAHPGREPMHGALDLQLELPLKDVEELPGPGMSMPHLGGGRRHPLLNDTEVRGAYEMPAVAPGAPGVVLGRGGRHRSGQRSYPPETRSRPNESPLQLRARGPCPHNPTVHLPPAERLPAGNSAPIALGGCKRGLGRTWRGLGRPSLTRATRAPAQSTDSRARARHPGPCVPPRPRWPAVAPHRGARAGPARRPDPSRCARR